MKANEIEIPVGKYMTLQGNLKIPSDAGSIVIFSHGSGSGRFSPRNTRVAETLNKAKIATLLIDLLTKDEDVISENRFNIDLITGRLITVSMYIHQLQALKSMNIGYYGTSTGAASALNAAAKLEQRIHAVVSRGGRPDLSDSLEEVKAPTLLIVGSNDEPVITLNRKAYKKLKGEKEMVIVEGASHLFEEPGKLNEVGSLATDWFKKHLPTQNRLTKNK